MSQRKDDKTKTEGGGGVHEATAAVDRHRLFSSMFFERHAHNNRSDHSAASDTATNESKKRPNGKKNPAETGNEQQQPRSQIDGALSQIEKQIPRNGDQLRQTALFKGALQMVQYQRDNYLVGKEYADWRKNDRQREQQQRNIATMPPPLITSFDIPYDDKALGHQQLARFAKDFIPSPTVQKALTPIVVGLPTGALYEPTRDASVNIIHGQSANLEATVKWQLLQFLDNPKNRTAMKNSTQGIIIDKATNKTNAKKENNALDDTTDRSSDQEQP